MEKFKKILWGVALVVISVILGLNELEITKINIFFEGWWTLFIIVPCFFDLITGENRSASLTGMVIGVALLLASRGVISFDIIWKLAFPFILVMVGLNVLFKDSFDKKLAQANKNNVNKDDNCVTIFGGDEINLENKEFDGANLTALFGGIDYDISKAKIKGDTAINCYSIFGGIDIKVPKDINVKVKSTSIFGGVGNKNNVEKESKKTIYINAVCIFGGVEIK